MARTGRPRVVDVTMDLDAPRDAVWRALTDARELARWFPLQARVRPGPGGEIVLSWGPPWEGASRIETWEPESRLRTRGFLEQGEASAIEYTLEGAGGRTRLRLVQSGFAEGTDWDDELFEGTVRGWAFELRSLRHYLQRHRGEDRVVAWPRVPIALGAGDAWRRVFGLEGLARKGSVEGRREGDPYRLVAASGDVFAGTVLVNDPPFEFAGTVESLGDGIVSVRTREPAGPRPEDGRVACVWLSAWGKEQGEVEAPGERCRTLLRAVVGT